MKIVFPLFGLIALLGIGYGLAFVGVIPTQKMADKSPGLAQTLITLHLAKAKNLKPAQTAALNSAPLSPEQKATNTEKKQLADDKATLAKAQADFAAQKQAASAAQKQAASAVPSASAVPNSAAKLDAIYAAMSPDDMLAIFAKLPDPDVIAALMPMDEKKAGKVLAGLPPARAARLTRQMSHPHPASSALASL